MDAEKPSGAEMRVKFHLNAKRTDKNAYSSRNKRAWTHVLSKTWNVWISTFCNGKTFKMNERIDK